MFADGSDFSWETIDKNRNLYYQNQLAQQILNEYEETMRLISSSLNIHLNIGQSFVTNTSQAFMSIEAVSINSIANKLIRQSDDAQIQLPTNVVLNQSNDSTVLIRVRCFSDGNQQ